MAWATRAVRLTQLAVERGAQHDAVRARPRAGRACGPRSASRTRPTAGSRRSRPVTGSGAGDGSARASAPARGSGFDAAWRAAAPGCGSPASVRRSVPCRSSCGQPRTPGITFSATSRIVSRVSSRELAVEADLHVVDAELAVLREQVGERPVAAHRGAGEQLQRRGIASVALGRLEHRGQCSATRSGDICAAIQPSPMRPARSSAMSEWPPIEDRDRPLHRAGLGVHRRAGRGTRRGTRPGRPRRTRARAGARCAPRCGRPRRSHGMPIASASSRSHPTPTP